MPKINAPTAAGHRAQRREALIGAASDILVNEGAAVTLAAVGARAGLIAGMPHRVLAVVDGGAPLHAVAEHTLVLVRRCLAPLGSMVHAPEEGH
ncbi:hypothetical protein GCM10010420_56220 [Streptomyces glaucosporus]|uniref:Uncharacterized protein n=1 Tax=Streptomyces glaucosporus TaxID=284044 RepID=A0ABP5W6E8_9ACTN